MTISRKVQSLVNERGNTILDITGEKFGMLTVLRYSRTDPKYGAQWLCHCECGNDVVYATGQLRTGRFVSCGCFRHSFIAKRNIELRKAKTGMSDFVGVRFGALTIIDHAIDEDGGAAWVCKCDCGNTVIRKTSSLNRSDTPSCGCKRGLNLRSNLTGRRFGRLVAVRRNEIESIAKRTSVWDCTCDCGNTVSVRAALLTFGTTRSCGCLQREEASRIGADTLINSPHKHTKYAWHVNVKGERINLRSSFEVIFAKHLIKHHIRFEYEPERINLAPDTIYIPDFYLPDTDTWVEVKGYASPRWLRKRKMFEATGRRLVVISSASIETYLPGISYHIWMKRNAYKYLRKSKE